LMRAKLSRSSATCWCDKGLALPGLTFNARGCVRPAWDDDL